MTGTQTKLVLIMLGAVTMSAWSDNLAFAQQGSLFISWEDRTAEITELERPACTTIASAMNAMVVRDERWHVFDICSEETKRIAEDMLDIICGKDNGVMALFCNADGSIDKKRSQARCGRQPDAIAKVVKT